MRSLFYHEAAQMRRNDEAMRMSEDEAKRKNLAAT
jgi:hypothetical protein